MFTWAVTCMQRLLHLMRYQKTWRLLVCRDDKNHIFSFDEIWSRKNLTTFGLHPFDDAIWKGNRVWIHSFERKLPALSNAVSGKVVRRIGCEVFDLKARGDIFLNHPVKMGREWNELLEMPNLGDAGSYATPQLNNPKMILFSFWRLSYHWNSYLRVTVKSQCCVNVVPPGKQVKT